MNSAIDHHLNIYLQNSSGGLDLPISHLVGDPRARKQITTVALGDLNGDMRADAAVGSYSAGVAGNFIGIFYQASDGTLEPMIRHDTWHSQRVALGDLNDDGRTDLLAGGGSGRVTAPGGEMGYKVFLELFLQDRSGDLIAPTPLEVEFVDPVGNVDLAVVDVTADGLDDIVVLALGIGSFLTDSRRVAVLRQKPGGSFETPAFFGDLSMHGFVDSLGVGDLDGDTLADIAVVEGGNRYIVDPYAIVFLQDGAGSFSPAVRYPAFEIPHSAEIADIDQDGLNDIVAAQNAWSSLSVFSGAGRGVMFPYTLHSLPGSQGTNPQALAVGDLDSDGYPDALFADALGPPLVLYNQATGPPLPRSLSVRKDGSGTGTVISEPAGIDCGPTCIAYFTFGTKVTLRAVPNPGARFSGWKGLLCIVAADGSCKLDLKVNDVGVAFFDRVGPPLTVTTTGSGTGTVMSDPPGISCGADCSEQYPWGTSVTLSAHPDPLSTFESWTGPCSGTAPCRVIMEGPLSVEAEFDPSRPSSICRSASGPLTRPRSTTPTTCRRSSAGTPGRRSSSRCSGRRVHRSASTRGPVASSGCQETLSRLLWVGILRLAKSAGVAHWRVKGRDASGSRETSETRTILLAAQQAPALTAPAEGQVFSAQEPAPTLVWESNHNESYRIVFSWRPDLGGKPKARSGKGYTLKGTAWTIPDATWERIKSKLAPKGGGTVHYAVFAKDLLGRKTRSITYTLQIQ
jgi:hypothetical protein